MNLEFRRAIVPDEIDELCGFDRRAFASFPADLFDAEDWAQFVSHWMIVDGEIVGCSAMVHNKDFDETARPGSLWIASTGVAPEQRRKGFGKILKQWQIQYAKENGFRVIVTNMRQSNIPIIKLNEKLGFIKRELCQGYYSDPLEDAIVMELEL